MRGKPPILPLHQQPAPHMHAVSTHVCLGCVEKEHVSPSFQAQVDFLVDHTGGMLQQTRLCNPLTAEPYTKAPALSLCLQSRNYKAELAAPCAGAAGSAAAPVLAGPCGRGCPWSSSGWSPASLASDGASSPSLGSCICISTLSAPLPGGTSGSHRKRWAGMLAGTGGEDHRETNTKAASGWEDAGPLF